MNTRRITVTLALTASAATLGVAGANAAPSPIGPAPTADTRAGLPITDTGGDGGLEWILSLFGLTPAPPPPPQPKAPEQKSEPKRESTPSPYLCIPIPIFDLDRYC